MISSTYLGNLVVIRWIDAKEIDYGWHSLETIKEINCPAILSVGWVAQITDNEIKISADIPTDKEDDEEGRSQVIEIGSCPRANILMKFIEQLHD